MKTFVEQRTAKVDGQVVGLGDYVCMKDDYEVCGKIIHIDSQEITIEYEGSHGPQVSSDSPSRCWID